MTELRGRRMMLINKNGTDNVRNRYRGRVELGLKEGSRQTTDFDFAASFCNSWERVKS